MLLQRFEHDMATNRAITVLASDQTFINDVYVTVELELQNRENEMPYVIVRAV